MKNDFEKLEYEHSVDNQIPFLQKLNPKIEILPLVIGDLSEKAAQDLANNLAKIKDAIFIISTDLSHFLDYKQAIKKDKETISIIQNLDLKNADKLDACGQFPLMVLMHLCKLKGWKPQLIEYKNSGDFIREKESVVGYAGMWF
jgi:hypothetical protein